MPLLATEASVSDTFSADGVEKRHHHHHHHNNVVEEELRVALINHTVYFHDYTMAVINDLPGDFITDNDARLRQNAANIALLAFPNDVTVANQVATLLINYINTGEAFVLTLDAVGDFSDPTVQASYNAWVAAGNQVAVALYQLKPRRLNLTDIQNIFNEYTVLQASVANNLVATAVNNPNFSQASYLYFQARILAAEAIAPVMARAGS